VTEKCKHHKVKLYFNKTNQILRG